MFAKGEEGMGTNDSSGSDSAPHPTQAKEGKSPAAGVFTQPYVTQFVLAALEEAVRNETLRDDDVTQEKLEAFLTWNGRRFYNVPKPDLKVQIVLERKGEIVEDFVQSDRGDIKVKNSRAGKDVHSLRWAKS